MVEFEAKNSPFLTKTSGNWYRFVTEIGKFGIAL
jgi:hypothetical protein